MYKRDLLGANSFALRLGELLMPFDAPVNRYELRESCFATVSAFGSSRLKVRVLFRTRPDASLASRPCRKLGALLISFDAGMGPPADLTSATPPAAAAAFSAARLRLALLLRDFFLRRSRSLGLPLCASVSTLSLASCEPGLREPLFDGDCDSLDALGALRVGERPLRWGSCEAKFKVLFEAA